MAKTKPPLDLVANPQRKAKGKALTAKRGKRGHRAVVHAITRAQRMEKAVDLLVDQQLTYEQIGKHFGVTAKTICEDLHEAFRLMHERTKERLEHLVTVEIRRTLRNDRAILPMLYGIQPAGKNAKQVPPGILRSQQLKAHERLTASIERRARLLGLDKPLKIAPTTPEGDRPYANLTDAELEQLVREREQLLGIKPVIDVTRVNGHTNGSGGPTNGSEQKALTNGHAGVDDDDDEARPGPDGADEEDDLEE